MLRRPRDIVLIAFVAMVAALVAAFCSAPDVSVPEVGHSPVPVAPRPPPAPEVRPVAVVPPDEPAPVAPDVDEPPVTTKPRPEGLEDDEVYLTELLTLAARAVDPEVEALDVMCATDGTRCRVRAPLHDDTLDEDTLWNVARAAVLEASAGDAALTRARALDAEGEPSLMELEITLTLD